MTDHSFASTPQYVTCRCGGILETYVDPEITALLVICPECTEPWDKEYGRLIKSVEIPEDDEEGFYLVRKPR